MKKEIFLLVGSVLLVIVCLEVGLRIYRWPRGNDGSAEQYLCQYDVVLGWRGKPNLHVTNFFEDGPFVVDSNSRGWREREYTLKKPQGIKRIVVLGDSFTWGYAVRYENSYSKVLEKKLGDKYQVISLGMPGYSTDQEFLVLSREGLNYEPDVVILSLFLDDIFTNGNMATHNGKYPKPYYTIGKDGGLILKNVPVPFLKSPLRSFEFVNSEIYKLRTILHTPSEFPKDSWHNVFNPRYLGSNDGEITFKLLQEINNLCRSRGIKFMITVIPLKFQLSKRNLRLPQEVLLEFGKKTAIPVLDFLPYFEDYKYVSLYFKTDLHWNGRGHYVAAQAVYDFLYSDKIVSE